MLDKLLSHSAHGMHALYLAYMCVHMVSSLFSTHVPTTICTCFHPTTTCLQLYTFLYVMSIVVYCTCTATC